MCGIFFSLSSRPDVKPNDHLRHALWVRGPDCMRSHRVSLDLPWPVQRATPTKRPLRTHVSFVGTLLSLRGDGLASQPLVDSSTGCCFAWNGEAWKIGNEQVAGNDSPAVFSFLSNSISSSTEADIPDVERANLARTAFFHALDGIVGPFSFVFYDALYHRVFFGRDRLGRRSLMFRRDLTSGITIASVSDREGLWAEVKANGVYELDLKTFNVPNSSTDIDVLNLWTSDHGLRCLPWQRHCLLPKLGGIIQAGQSCDMTHNPLSHMVLNRNLDSIGNKWLNLQSDSVTQLEAFLKNSLGRRVRNVPNHDPESLSDQAPKVAVLFSGGVDCSVIARIMHEIVPHDLEVDLLNVAFENPRSMAAAKATVPNNSNLSAGDPYAGCPDRLTGLSSYAELQITCPSRVWRFVSINIPYMELMAHRDEVISLMFPHDTEMDLSIACALYFAARGQGVVTGENKDAYSYTTPARVLLSGLGADELFAGYTRHATAFNRRGHPGLLEELDLDIHRLSERNLGRDDRVTAQWGKELRYPYLDEDLVCWALALPLWAKCGFGQEEFSSLKLGAKVQRIEPAKKILRFVALKLGMSGAAMEKKRAIQFGARTAKMTAGRTKGSDVIKYSLWR